MAHKPFSLILKQSSQKDISLLRLETALPNSSSSASGLSIKAITNLAACRGPTPGSLLNKLTKYLNFRLVIYSFVPHGQFLCFDLSRHVFYLIQKIASCQD